MRVLSNTLEAFVGGEPLDPKSQHISLFIRKRHQDAEADRADSVRGYSGKPEWAYLQEMADLDRPEEWQGAGILLLVDTRSGIAARVRYHGPSLDEIGQIRLVARLAFKSYGRDVVVVDTKESPLPIPMELEIYQLDPQNQRIWVVSDDGKGGMSTKLVWPEPGVDTFEAGLITVRDVASEGTTNPVNAAIQLVNKAIQLKESTGGWAINDENVVEALRIVVATAEQRERSEG